MKNPRSCTVTRGMAHSFWYIYTFGKLNQMPGDQIHLTIKKAAKSIFFVVRSSSAFVYFATWLISDSIRKHISKNCCRNDADAHIPSQSCHWLENIRLTLPVKIRRLQTARVARDKSDVKVYFGLPEIHKANDSFILISGMLF